MKRLLPLLAALVLLLTLFGGTALAENKFYFDKDYNTVFEDGVLQLVMVREGDCADEGELSFTSSNRKCATVDQDGLVYGISKGQTTITATLKGAKRTWTAKFTVTVARAVTDITVTETSMSVYEPWDPLVADALNPYSEYSDLPVLLLRVGKSQTVSAKCTPSDATNRTWELVSSDAAIVRASGTTLTGKKAGECLVTIRSKQNPEVEKRYRALVVQPVTSVKVTCDQRSLFVGDALMLDVSVGPQNATIKGVTWSSDKPETASVDEYGVVTGLKKGSAVITARAADGSGRYSTFTVTVKQQPEYIELSRTDFQLKTGRYLTLTATVKPSNANDKTVTWTSSDPDVAKVSTSGRVTAVSPGVAIITCRSKTHPEVAAQAVVSVYQPVTKITFNEKNPYVGVGESIRLSWAVGPDTAADPSVTLSTNKESVVRVSQDGTITGLKRGECYIYATANDGSDKRASIKVTVTQPVEGVTIEEESITVGVGEKATNNAVILPSDASITTMTWYAEDATIASVSGTGKRVSVTGRNWGETTIIGVTEDGSYVTTFTVQVGDENKPLNITKLYVEDESTIRIAVYNESDMTITRFYYVIETYDAWGEPLVCNKNGRSNSFEGSYKYTLEPGTATAHGRFSFGSEFSRPYGIGQVVMRITGYETADGNSRYIPRSQQETREWKVKILDWEDYD